MSSRVAGRAIGPRTVPPRRNGRTLGGPLPSRGIKKTQRRCRNEETYKAVRADVPWPRSSSPEDTLETLVKPGGGLPRGFPLVRSLVGQERGGGRVILTEKEARAVTCPFATPMSDYPGPFDCVASDCAAWRWVWVEYWKFGRIKWTKKHSETGFCSHAPGVK